MAFTVTTTWHNAGTHTIWGRLAEKLGREPTHAEAKAEVLRILREGTAESAERGDLWFQRGRLPR